MTEKKKGYTRKELNEHLREKVGEAISTYKMRQYEDEGLLSAVQGKQGVPYIYTAESVETLTRMLVLKKQSFEDELRQAGFLNLMSKTAKELYKPKRKKCLEALATNELPVFIGKKTEAKVVTRERPAVVDEEKLLETFTLKELEDRGVLRSESKIVLDADALEKTLEKSEQNRFEDFVAERRFTRVLHIEFSPGEKRKLRTSVKSLVEEQFTTL